MKKLLVFVPVLLFLLLTIIGSRLFTAGVISKGMLMVIPFIALAIAFLARPKAKAKPASDLEKKARGEFALDAFQDDPKLEAKFLAAMKDYNGNMPKAALNKLTKLAPLCTGEKEIYAVAMATAQCQLVNGKPLPAIREYTRALSIHPSSDVAMELGGCHQRLGNLEKAMDSYEFALDLDPQNVEARCRLATAYVADHDFETALKHAQMALDVEETNASALATTAICHGLLNDPVMSKHYTKLAVENGYSQKKIEETISTLKKRV